MKSVRRTRQESVGPRPHGPSLKIGRTQIGGSSPCFIVAEIGINFDGKKEQAFKLIDVAADAHCSAVKFQLFTAERMYAREPGTYTTASGMKHGVWDLIKENELPPEWIPELMEFAKVRGLEFFATVGDEKSGDILAAHDVPAFKFASYEITHIPLFRHMATKGKPIIFSSGGATLGEVDEAMRTIREEGLEEIVLMHCVGQYPAPLSALNLNVIRTFKLAFPQVVIGYSDHSREPVEAPRAAVALGANVIEKHITLDRNLPGPDHSFAVEPSELQAMVQAIRKTEWMLQTGREVRLEPALLGSPGRRTFEGEQYVRNFAYRKIFATRDIQSGELLTSENIAVLRPGEKAKGEYLHPRYYPIILGHRVTRDIRGGQGLAWDDILQE